MPAPALAAAYRRAIYRVLPHRDRYGETEAIDLRIGRRSAALDRLLAKHGATTWVFLTATNPGSRRLTDAENRRRTRNLAATLARRRWPRLRGEGLDPTGRWPPEPSYLVLDAPLDSVLNLAARLGQAAIVAGRLRSSARLVWLSADRS